MFKIDFLIPEKTISLENSRKLETMDLEDILNWCFSAQIEFLVSGQSLLYLPEVCLFQIVDGFSDSAKQIWTQDKSQTAIQDRYSSFLLFIEESEGLVVIRIYKGVKFQISTTDFMDGTNNFIKSVIDRTKDLFPDLNLNPNYIDAVKKWKSAII